ncbi:MAG: hypothetical protein HKN42_09425 [Granulosicoccus sp.]|nr:hypothetical protein [Granulosicoccus sp.]
MSTTFMQFDAIAESTPGPKWLSRWHRSWPEYRAWFISRGGANGPSRKACEQALETYMPELSTTYRQLCRLAGNDDLSARFLSTWCPPAYLGGCSIAALSGGDSVRLVRNYDLSPELNEGLLLHSNWTGKPVMGMIEFLWGLSDAVNTRGLSVALAYGGRCETGRGFGVTTILRYIMETCGTVAEAVRVLERVPSHMAYNITLADRVGAALTIELTPGGGVRRMQQAVTTNHQHGRETAMHPVFTRTIERLEHLKALLLDKVAPRELPGAFLKKPLHQDDYANGMGTLFTAEYDPRHGTMTLHWLEDRWSQSLHAFEEGVRMVSLHGNSAVTQSACQVQFAPASAAPTAPTAPATHTLPKVPISVGDGAFNLETMINQLRPNLPAAARQRLDDWHAQTRHGETDWCGFGRVFY